MMATIAPATSGQGEISGDLEVLRAALAAAQAPELEEEITEHGRGATIHHGMMSRGMVPARDLASWICLEKKCSRVRRNTLDFRVDVRYRLMYVSAMSYQSPLKIEPA